MRRRCAERRGDDGRDQYRSADVDLGKKTSEEVDVELLGVYQRKHQQEIFHFS